MVVNGVEGGDNPEGAELSQGLLMITPAIQDELSKQSMYGAGLKEGLPEGGV